MNDFSFIAQILSAGKDGFVKIQLLDKVFDSIIQLNNIVYLDFWGRKKKFIIEDTFKVKNSFFIKFANFNDERDLLALIGRKIYLPGERIPLSPEKEFLLNDLIDCQVFRDNNLIGTVKAVFNAPANDVIEIIKLDEKEILIPFVDAYFELVDVKNKKLILKPDVGYYDDED